MSLFKAITALLVACCTFGLQSAAQSPAHVTQPLQWSSLNLNIGLTPAISVMTEGNFRFVQSLQLQQIQWRSGVDFAVTKKLSILPLGFVYSWNPMYGKQPAAFVNNEYRFFQQFNFKHKTGRVSLAHRLRTEERNIQRHHRAENNVVVDDGYSNDQFRIRYRLSGSIPLRPTVEGRPSTYLLVWNELFYSWGKYVKYHSPSQNRVFLGLGHQASRSINLQGGLFYQWLKKDNGLMTENNIGFLVQLNLVFPAHPRLK